MIRLIADGGSTKVDWLLQRDGEDLMRLTTQGINPALTAPLEIERCIKEELVETEGFVTPDEIEYYGAGCRGESCKTLEDILRKVMPQAQRICVDSDLVGAARALFGKEEEGIACILGTGCNSGLYVGGKIVKNVPPLGYILGDEGSGAVLGRRLVGDRFKRLLPNDLCVAFDKEYHLTTDQLIAHTYKMPFANRYLAQFTHFLSAHRSHPAVHTLLVEEFERFFRRNVAVYQRPGLCASFVGSIAYYFSEELKEAAHNCGFKVGKIIKAPL